MTGDAVGHANQLVAVLEARGREIWGAGWAWIEGVDEFQVFPGRYRTFHAVHVRFFGPTGDICRMMNAASEAEEPFDLEGEIECAVFDGREDVGGLTFPVQLVEMPELAFREPLLEMQFQARSSPQIQELLDRRRP